METDDYPLLKDGAKHFAEVFERDAERGIEQGSVLDFPRRLYNGVKYEHPLVVHHRYSDQLLLIGFIYSPLIANSDVRSRSTRWQFD